MDALKITLYIKKLSKLHLITFNSFLNLCLKGKTIYPVFYKLYTRSTFLTILWLLKVCTATSFVNTCVLKYIGHWKYKLYAQRLLKFICITFEVHSCIYWTTGTTYYLHRKRHPKCCNCKRCNTVSVVIVFGDSTSATGDEQWNVLSRYTC